MGNIGTTFKRFLSNKNTITILGVIVGIVVLYIGYNWRVNTAIEEIEVPYAKTELKATTPITQDSVGMTKVLKSFVSGTDNLLQNRTSVVSSSTNNYCVNIGTTVPKGSLFYSEQVVECNSIGSNVFANMPDNYKPVSMDVTLRSTYGNSMLPGNYIDIYVRTEYDGKLVYGELISKLPILDVRDSQGKSLFYGATTNQTPSVLLFAVPDTGAPADNLYLLLSKASMLDSIELIPVPGNKAYTSEVGETVVKSEWLKNLIREKTTDVPDAAINEITE